MALDILGDPFADSASISVSESGIREAAPSMPDTKVQDLIRAANREEFDKQEGVNEKFLLDKELNSIASSISAELGPFALDVYENGQDVVSAGVLRTINEGDRTGSFRGQNASGGSQWDIQQLTVDGLEESAAFAAAANASTFRTYTTNSGEFNIAPAIGDGETETRDPANDGGNNVGTEDDGRNSPDDDQQNLFILGFYASTNPRVVEQAVVDINDGESRTPFDAFGHSNLGTLQAFNTPSMEYITDDDTYDINGSSTQATTTDFYPFGVDLNAASNIRDLLSTSA